MTNPEQSYEDRLRDLSRAFRMSRADVGDLTAEQIRKMPMREFARLEARVLGDDDPDRAAVTPAKQESHGADYAADIPEHMGVPPDFRAMGMDEYARVRKQDIKPGSGHGLFS